MLCKLVGTQTCALPKCAACQYAKAKLLPDKILLSRVNSDKDGALEHNILKPGQEVSTDQYVSSLRGILSHTKGRKRIEIAFLVAQSIVMHPADL